MPSESNSSRVVFFVAVVLVAIGFAAYKYFTFFPVNGPANDGREDAAEMVDLAELLELKDDSVAALENIDLKKSADGFRKIVEAAPEEPVGLQNLAITLLLKLEKTDQTREPKAAESIVQEMEQTLNLLEKLPGRKSITDELRGRFAAKSIKRDALLEAARRFKAASDENETLPSLAYMAFDAMSANPREFSADERLKMLRRGYAIRPENLALTLELLKALAEDNNPDVAALLTESRPRFRPLSPVNTPLIEKFLDAAEAAAKEEDWKSLSTNLAFVGNLLKPEIAYTNDLHQMTPHVLERVVLDFSKEFYREHLVPKGAIPKPIGVAFFIRELDIPHGSPATAVYAEDFDLQDGFELFVAYGKTLKIVKPGSDAKSEVLLEREMPIEVQGLLAADLDRDFQRIDSKRPLEKGESFVDTDLDLIVYGLDGIRLLRNDLAEDGESRTLSPVPAAGLDDLTDVRAVVSVDLDHDGDLDLAVASSNGLSLWSSLGNWQFIDITPYSHLPDAKLGITGLAYADFNRDVLIDLIPAIPVDDRGYVVRNVLHGRYTTGVLAAKGQALGGSRAVAVLDANRDAVWDTVTAGESGTRLTLMEPSGEARSVETLSETPAAGVAVWDYDNDGLSDVVSWGDENVQVFRGDGRGGFTLYKGDESPLPKGVPSLAILDVDGDGDQDLAAVVDGTVRLIVNEGGNANHWIDLRLRAEAEAQTPRERTNMHGVGSLLELKAGMAYQAQVVAGTSTHFGLGQAMVPDTIRILWTNGIPHHIVHPKADATIYEQQYLISSCPYLYTWNGDEFVFCTDCLWASPLGLQHAKGILAPFREWEYLKVDGGLLKPRGDEYVLQMTEELWEAAYYDSVKLMAVDHPVNVEVYTNEKVGPAEIAEFKVYTVTNRRLPVSAVDQTGKDVLETICSRDRKYTKSWEKGFTQGLVENHWVELDLGDLSGAKQVTLFLTGWVFPTTTSLNLAIDQNPLLPQPKPPAIQVRDENGEWREVIPYAGFPGGKTKTIAVDLSDAFLTDDFRVRVVSNMEICWDEIFFSVDEPEAKYRLVDLPLVGAELHYRGFSARIPQPHNGPEFYDYQSVTRAPVWAPMGGAFTRFGDVTELVSDADDRLVVMGAGDEMTVRFSVPAEATPGGWVRDFVVYNIGWDKDADPNTILGQQVEPLPFRAMSRYPYGPDGGYPQTPQQRRYLETYQTRHQNVQQFWNRIRNWRRSPLN